MKPSLKIIHTADIHLGAKFVGLGNKGSDQRRRLRECVGDIIDYVISENADMLLIAGDVFDNQQPSPESISALTHGVQRLRDADIPAVMIAGTHDSLREDGVLKRWAIKQAGVVLLTPEQPVWIDEQKQLCVQGVSLTSAHEPKRPLTVMHKPEGDYWQIGMVHAALEMGRENPQEAVFSLDEIAKSALHYLALGHWHRRRECSKGKTVAWYPGSPEMIALDESEPGTVLKIEFLEGCQPKVTPYVVGKRSLVEITLELYDVEAILTQIRNYADVDKVLLLRLQGIIPPELFPDISEIARALEKDFFYVRVKNEFTATIKKDVLDQYGEQTVMGKFVRIVRDEKDGVDAKTQLELDQVLQLGLALLAGREVPPCS
ncbi:DNA repair exonuclease [bacterium]|nr:DNA repair exonuclease [bacterium]